MERLTSRETAELMRRYLETGDCAARNRVVEAHLYIARIIARRFSGRGVDADDLFQVASLALVKAAERFDPSRGAQFSTYVTPVMVGEVRNYFRDKSQLIRPPRRAGELARIVERASETLTQRLCRSPRVDEIAREASLTEDEVLEGLEAASLKPVSLDAQIAQEDGEASIADALGFDDPAYADMELRDTVARAMRELPEREREVLRMRFYGGLSQRETAEKLGISQMSVSRAERGALEKMRRKYSDS